VNTVVRDAGALVGSNTDWSGAVRALERETRLSGARAVVLGAGGTARAVVHGLLERGARVRVLNRTVARARDLCDELGADSAGPLSSLSAAPYDVLVNTTRVGMNEDVSPVEVSALTANAVVMDAVYEPERTRLLRDAEARGARIVAGKWMLVYQAALQIEAWTGRQPPIDVMAEAFDRAGKRP
jgi:shikimate dehydrogenase